MNVTRHAGHHEHHTRRSVSGIRAKGVQRVGEEFCTQPIAIVTPINILEICSSVRCHSACGCFGNVLGAFIIMEMLKTDCTGSRTGNIQSVF
jgi:hypothetical protein